MAENSLRAFILLAGVLPLNLGGKTVFILHLMRCEDEAVVPRVVTAFDFPFFLFSFFFFSVVVIFLT